MKIELKIIGLRAHKGHTSNHSPSGSIPMHKLNNKSFLMGQVGFVFGDENVAIPGLNYLPDLYADVFLRRLNQVLLELKNDNVTDLYMDYHYDQGEPLYLFSRKDNDLTISIVEDEGKGERWNFTCSYDAFVRSCNEAFEKVRELLVQHAGSKGEKFYQEQIICNYGKDDPNVLLGIKE